MSVPITVVVVDDQELMRMGLNMVLEAQDDIEVIGEASDGSGAIEAVARLAPAVVLMDVRMPGIDGVSATRAITESGSDTRVLVMTTWFRFLAGSHFQRAARHVQFCGALARHPRRLKRVLLYRQCMNVCRCGQIRADSGFCQIAGGLYSEAQGLLGRR